jgi:phosphatidylglycerol---prolipoprotein diacylglyceryl transferase
MRRVLFTVWGRNVWSYPAMLYLGLVVGLVLGNLEANLRGLDGIRVYLATVVLLVPALAGARLAYVLGHRDEFRGHPGLIWRHDVGGQAMYGGLVAVPLSVPLLIALDVPFWSFWDVATFTMLAGMVLTRVGCLLNGCCSGRATEGRFGMVLPDAGGVVQRRIPTQLLEAGMGASVLAAVSFIPTDAPPGSVFLSAVVGYSLGRLVLQGTRERDARVRGLSTQRAAAVAFVAVAIVLFAVSRL